jgi:hypothetical protein
MENGRGRFSTTKECSWSSTFQDCPRFKSPIEWPEGNVSFGNILKFL